MIIDYVDGLEITDDQAEKYFNELRSLDYLAKGLKFLNDQVRSVEAEVIRRVGKDKQVSMFCNDPQLKGILQDLVACAFHWYAVTACNYVKLVGWLANGGDSTKAAQYLKDVLPAVRLWRNKVGAHFARTDPMKEDTPADLAMSVIFPICFEDGAFYAGSLTLGLDEGGKSYGSRDDMQWSLTHTHRELSARYWPEPTANK